MGTVLFDKNLSETIANQENEYRFPYHYVAQYGSTGFRQHFNDSWGINYVSTIELVLDKLAALSPLTVVDIGCGDGRLTREIYTNLSVERVVGVDYSIKAVNLAKAMNQDIPKIEFYSEDIMASSNRLGLFDAAVLMEVFEHIPVNFATAFMGSVRALIKSGGSLLMTVPHANKPIEYKHFQHFTIDQLLGYLKSNFEIIKVVPFERRGIRRRTLNMLLSNGFFILNNQKILDILYNWYKASLFNCDHERHCQRIFVHTKAK
jgi:2-polyprenyl-3-methyl-5-hydroxy-6-metoxy-1,4-benzoquinol methylase